MTPISLTSPMSVAGPISLGRGSGDDGARYTGAMTTARPLTARRPTLPTGHPRHPAIPATPMPHRGGAGPAYNLTTRGPGRLGTGLTASDADRVAAAIAAGHADSTRVVYACAWRRWDSWCATRGLVPLPGAPDAVSAYLTDRADQGISMSTIDLACSAIGHEHRRHGLDNPVLNPTVRQVRRGLRRTLGAAPRRRARALTVTDIAGILASLDRTSSKGTRDAAIILLGFASAVRRSELAALTLADIEARPGGLLLTIRDSKTDPQRSGQVVGVAHGQHAHTDPVAAVTAWIALRGTTAGPLFTSMRSGRIGQDPISGNAIALMLRARAEAAGLPADRITGHSLRAGHATAAALAGVALDRIAAQTRHRNIGVLIEHYIRPAQALAATSSRDLGL